MAIVRKTIKDPRGKKSAVIIYDTDDAKKLKKELDIDLEKEMIESVLKDFKKHN